MSILAHASAALLVVFTTAFFSSTALSQSCSDYSAELSDLYCFELTPTPDHRGTKGSVLLRPAKTPFGVAVTRNGTPRYNVTLVLSNLPNGTHDEQLVAWATTEFFEHITSFGSIRPGSSFLGEIAATKFVFFVGVTDSTSPAVTKTILRGGSPSTRLQGHDAVFSSPLAAINLNAPRRTEEPFPGNKAQGAGNKTSSSTEHAEHNQRDQSNSESAVPREDPQDIRESVSGGPDPPPWPHPPMHPEIAMAPGMHTLKPAVSPYWLNSDGQPDSDIPFATPRESVHLADGDTLELTAGLVRRKINGKTLLLLGYNNQYPGPLIRATESSTIVVRFRNNVNAPTAVHWHGIRLENRFDGVPGITQDPVEFGGSFTYRVHLPDPGLYWYHPHHREDIFQELGLYGNLIVDAKDENYYNTVTNEEVLVLDDLLLSQGEPVPFGDQSANYMFMGRFGNVYLLNGSTTYKLDVAAGDVTRFFLTNVSNTRTFNLSIAGARLKVIASDVSRFEREEWVESVVMAPAERYIIEAKFDSAGTFPILNQVHATNHTTGTFFPESDTLGFVTVQPRAPATTNKSAAATTFESLRTHEDVVADIALYRPFFSRPPDKNLVLTLGVRDLPPIVDQTMSLEAVYFTPVEWSGTMPMMNWASTGNEVQWILLDPDSDERNMDIQWNFSIGDVIKIRVVNDRNAFHAMQHPLHFHGQRFLVISQNGALTDNLVWKDTVLLPSGSTTDLLIDLTNPGTWMVHCHIAEHLESGMKMVFNVAE